ncbi:respiratory burst oxidase homolog protein B [Oryza sativa Japonica Group]|uniref:Os12g0541300 protein n=2 Tax=Oryza TaxID=4527 RepID=Q2QP56_ORYSJ|nr:respiratory burst oxidase homolog protein B [Oryza sativa Japonica Group]XP_015618609.1 respiratory burst oxidase homolog protein B [Oryza sativa Japonica Group]XP_015618610.1 respiratory burst oxidase homolog protein B [Oryza sativa Japonica Group]XP_015618611.1 respiratory burst oxidase homolog protein B [Oryza sativa Japonica Group]XP_025877991.1 respiratory burst oxidase homolog protein B [Oryza sativa Japonica Group]XP_052137770.1 respiratory burst oxidase homolog protein B-like [Oryza
MASREESGNGGGGGATPAADYRSSDSRSSSRRSTRFKEDNEYVEITLDVKGDDTVAIQSIRNGADMPEVALLARGLAQQPPPSAAPGPGGLSSRLKAVRTELRRIASWKFPSGVLSGGGGGGDAPGNGNDRRPRLDRSMTGAARALRGLQFLNSSAVTNGWPEVEKRFERLAVDGFLLRSRFGQCIGMVGSEEFAVQIFDSLARRRGITAQLLTKDQLREFWEQLSDPGFDAKLQTFFDMVDKNADGQITEEELKEVLTLTASANKLSKILERVDEYTALIMEELDPDQLGYIDISNLESLLLLPPSQAPSKLVTHSSNISQLISQKLVPTHDRNPLRRGLRRLSYFMEDNWKRVWVMALWLAINAGLFTWKFMAYKRHPTFDVMGYCVCVAKGGAETTKFNMALILLPVCRNTITWLRSRTKLGAVIPFNDNINFHKVVAGGVVVGVALHGVTHLTCDFPRLLHASDAAYEPMKKYFGQTRIPDYWWFVRGVEGITGVIMVVLMAIAYTLAHPWFRRSKLSDSNPLKRLSGFNMFWYSHHLFVIVYIAFVVHGVCLYINRTWWKQTTWMYLAIPILLYAGERIFRALRSHGFTTVRIEKVAIYPGNVIAIHMTKPHGFKYKSGQYIYVNCGEVSPFEWHPFTITSAPDDSYLSMHIRCRGDWTSSFRAIFSQICRPPMNGQSGLLRADCMSMEHHSRFPKLLIDGPYGAPAQDYWKYDVLLLIGLGIGATPLISIVKDVLNHIYDDPESAASPHTTNGGGAAAAARRAFMTKRVYFYWCTREEGSFEWFRGVMNEVADRDAGRELIELHNHCTSVYEEGDARSALVTMLQALHHAKNGVDVVSGTRVRTHFARPSWRDVFKRVAVNHQGQRVGVFFCGDQALTPELRRLAQDFSHKTTTKFVFHKENF